MENPTVSRDERQPAASLLLLPVLLCLSVSFAVCIGVLAFTFSREVPTSIGISGAVLGVGAALSWWVAPRLGS